MPALKHRLVAAPLPLARRLGRVQRQVRVPEQLVGVGAVLRWWRRRPWPWMSTDPEARVNGSANAADDPLGDRLHRGGIRDVLDQQRELITAQPRRHVGVAARPRTAAVPAATSSSSPTLWPIVSLTTLKSSRSTNSTPAVVPSRRVASQPAGGPVLEQQPVGQPGQRVVERPVLELLLELVLLGHVPQGQHQPADGALAAQVAAPDLDLDGYPVAAGDPHAPRSEDRRPACSRIRAQGPDQIVPLAVRRPGPTGSHALHGDVAEDARGRRGRVPDYPVVADDQDGVRGVLDQGPEVGLAAPADHLLR